MEYVDTAAFLAHAERLGIVPDRRYADPRYLVYAAEPSLTRLWDKPAAAGQVVNLIAAVLDGVGPWTTCDLWPRREWSRAAEREGGRPIDAMSGWLLRSAGVRPEFGGVIRYGVADRPALSTALFAAATFGWSVQHDLFVVPDHGRQIVMVDHHDIVNIRFAAVADVDPFVAHMTARGFPLDDGYV